jgi:hypothetical protein
LTQTQPRRKEGAGAWSTKSKAAGGDAIAVVGDVAADDIPAKILDAIIKYVR